jgi:lambda repressor-like predicted transcriptional regulator
MALARAYASGESMAELARTYGVCRETISKIIREAGVEIRTQRAISPEQIAEAAVLYRQGWSLARLAECYGFDGQTIHTHLKRAGIVMRRPHDWQDLT